MKKVLLLLVCLFTLQTVVWADDDKPIQVNQLPQTAQTFIKTHFPNNKVAMAAKADIVVICSSDDEYAEYAVPAFKALNGRAMFIVAGAPACMDDLKAAGIENFIHVRVNVLDTLKEFNAKLLK